MEALLLLHPVYREVALQSLVTRSHLYFECCGLTFGTGSNMQCKHAVRNLVDIEQRRRTFTGSPGRLRQGHLQGGHREQSLSRRESTKGENDHKILFQNYFQRGVRQRTQGRIRQAVFALYYSLCSTLRACFTKGLTSQILQEWNAKTSHDSKATFTFTSRW
jgi:hypothetical protein